MAARQPASWVSFSSVREGQARVRDGFASASVLALLPRGLQFGSVHRVLKHGKDPEFEQLVDSFVSAVKSWFGWLTSLWSQSEAWKPAAEKLAAYIKTGKAAGLDLRSKKLGAAGAKAW